MPKATKTRAKAPARKKANKLVATQQPVAAQPRRLQADVWAAGMQPKVDYTPLRNVSKAVISPSTAQPTRGCFGTAGPRQTVVQKRSATFAMTLNAAGKGESELAVVYNDCRDPYLVLAEKDSAGAWKTQFYNHVDAKDPINNTIPFASASRVVAATVSFEYTGPAQDMGGMLFHFPYDPDDGLHEPGAISYEWGHLNANAAQAASHVRVANKLSFAKPPETEFRPVVWLGDKTLEEERALWATGVPKILVPDNSAAAVDLGRFLLTAGTQPLQMLVTITTHVEYYHQSHSAFARKTVTHPVGDDFAQALATTMLEPGANNTLVSPSMLDRLARGIDQGTGVQGLGKVVLGAAGNVATKLATMALGAMAL